MSAEQPQQIDGLDVTEIPEGLVVYDTATDRVHTLNLSAGAVFVLCDGTRTVDGVVAEVAALWDLDPAPDAEVRTCVDALRAEGLLL